ncbi:motile sperm domain-containing protein 1 isoform X1 [Halyomorpha halys]|uniref:motile sperm domain-containing protein 1 isoform X1 n=1 Tax=Halyomorpha halys TaxID=286706 RepID=UPI0006D4EAEC|nr:motile sperm domain-containing protein 1-like isoform X1 [Halyomorpha halys]XP_014287494.1 motile sperm domain-containing protein 1-like isoform X1 [Halyomorpha halys]XP_014287502.1 motile sperm domain-containing protein 1-like isoform X1 [Halyomorpha halys]
MQPVPSAAISPVFVFPNAVNFFLGDQKTHKQVLTIYNVYDTPVRFRVLSTAPDKYNVVESEGFIKAHCSLDIVVRHKDVRPANCNVTDKFRVELLEYSTKKVLGKRDVPATLNSGIPDRDNGNLDESRGSEKYSFESRPLSRESTSRESSGRTRSGPNSFIILVGLTCIAGLLMPNEGECSAIPLQLSCHIKLVLAFVLGMVTYDIMQP